VVDVARGAVIATARRRRRKLAYRILTSRGILSRKNESGWRHAGGSSLRGMLDSYCVLGPASSSSLSEEGSYLLLPSNEELLVTSLVRSILVASCARSAVYYDS
jgi:hypothetical protein